MTIKQKPKKPKKGQKKRLKCYDCVHSSRYDSDFDNELPPDHLYCRKWHTIITCGFARWCGYFERNEPVRGKFDKKAKKRWKNEWK